MFGPPPWLPDKQCTSALPTCPGNVSPSGDHFLPPSLPRALHNAWHLANTQYTSILPLLPVPPFSALLFISCCSERPGHSPTPALLLACTPRDRKASSAPWSPRRIRGGRSAEAKLDRMDGREKLGDPTEGSRSAESCLPESTTVTGPRGPHSHPPTLLPPREPQRGLSAGSQPQVTSPGDRP